MGEFGGGGGGIQLFTVVQIERLYFSDWPDVKHS